MDKHMMLKFWELMGIEQIDEDHRTLQGMEQTPEVAWLEEVAEEAKAAHYEWLTEHYPERVEQARQVP